MTSTPSKRRKRYFVLLAAVIAVLASALGPAIDDAQAGRIGPYAAADVTCDTYYHSMRLQPNFGPSPYMSSQWLTYRYKIVDIDTGRAQWVQWAPAFQWSPFYVTGGIVEERRWAYVPEWYYFPGLGRFHVYTQYAWYDNGWSYSPLVRTIGYNGFYFEGGGAYCRTVSVNG